MKRTVILAVVCAALASTTLTGCIVAFGNRVPPAEGKATLGKQLTDLKQARESGAITDEEYQAAKKRLVEGK